MKEYESKSKETFEGAIGQMKAELISAIQRDSDDEDSDDTDDEEDDEEDERNAAMSQRSLRKRHQSFTLTFDPMVATERT